jgi:excisionase family DNA binding protein
MANSKSTSLFTINEAASYLRISRTSIYRLIKSGQIETVKLLSRKQLVERKVLDQFVSNPLLKNQEWNNNVN